MDNFKKYFLIISAVMLGLAVFCSFDYWFYQLLRWIVTISAGTLAFDLKDKSQWQCVLCILIAILFNPVAPIYLDKDIWRIVDVIIAIVFATVLFRKKGCVL